MGYDLRLRKPDILGSSLILAAMMMLLLPLKWLIAAVFAAGFHELCHWGMICLCKGRVTNFDIGTKGAVMQVDGLAVQEELLCALAGPVGGLCLLLFAKWIPRTAFCALVQSIYNLLPLFPLDGGRALKCMLELFLSEDAAEKICNAVAVCVKVFISVISLCFSFVLRAGILPLIMAAMLCLRTNYRKTLAN